MTYLQDAFLFCGLRRRTSRCLDTARKTVKSSRLTATSHMLQKATLIHDVTAVSLTIVAGKQQPLKVNITIQIDSSTMISQLLWIFPALRIVVFSAKHGRVNARAQAAIGYNVPPLYFVSSCPLLKGWMNFSINIKCNSTLSCTWYIDAQLHFILTQMQLILTLKTPYTSNGKDHIRNTELYRDLPKVSTRLRQRRLAFAGHF